MAITERAKLLLFVPYLTTARLNGTLYVNDLPHTDTEYLIADLNGVTEKTALVGAGVTNFNVTGLTLNSGETYTARLRYLNASGSATWSATSASTVAGPGFDLPVVPNLPALPGETGTPFPLSLAPSYRVEVETRRGIVTHITAAGQHIRRLTSIEGTRRVRLSWFGLTIAQRDTILSVLQDSLGTFASTDVRGFDFSTVTSEPRPLAGFTFLPIDGTIVHRELTAGIFEVSIDATEIKP